MADRALFAISVDQSGEPIRLVRSAVVVLDAGAGLTILTATQNAQRAWEARLVAEARRTEGIAIPEELSKNPSQNTQSMVRQRTRSSGPNVRPSSIRSIASTTRSCTRAMWSPACNRRSRLRRRGLSDVEKQLLAGKRLTEQCAIDGNSLLERKRKLVQEQQSRW